MKILVIGRSGQLALSLVERASGHSEIELSAAGRDKIDLEDTASIDRRIAKAGADVVVNAAAYTAVDAAEDDAERAFAVNAAGAGAVARAAAEAGSRFIHLSTDYVFDGSGDVPRDESAPTAPLGVYGQSKLAGEELVRANHPTALILRTAWVYSPFGRNFVRTMMTLAEQRDEIRVVDDQRGNPTSALDLADGILIACRHGWDEGGVYHLAGTGNASWADVAAAVMDECARLGVPSATIERIGSDEYPTKAKRPRNSQLDSGAFERAFGYRCPLWRYSVTAVVDRLAGTAGGLKTAGR